MFRLLHIYPLFVYSVLHEPPDPRTAENRCSMPCRWRQLRSGISYSCCFPIHGFQKSEEVEDSMSSGEVIQEEWIRARALVIIADDRPLLWNYRILRWRFSVNFYGCPQLPLKYHQSKETFAKNSTPFISQA